MKKDFNDVEYLNEGDNSESVSALYACLVATCDSTLA